MTILLASTYELGRQPFGLASPAAWLEREGHQVICADLAIEPLTDERIRAADAAAFFLPMHTATRLAIPAIKRAKKVNPSLRLACYGLYAWMNADLLRGLGVEAILGGEFESGLVRFARGEAPQGVFLDRQAFVTPQRSGLPDLRHYAKLSFNGSKKLVGYTEASRGCKHLCRHCPVVPVYQGQFRIVQREAVMTDIRQQAQAGAAHITFGDPDFFNGPKHAIEIVRAMHSEFPGLTYDVTIKIEHLLKLRGWLPTLKETGCLFVTSAVESVDDEILAKLEKNHTRRDVIEAATLMRKAGLHFAPTFIPFTPWTTVSGYRDLLSVIADLELIGHVAPVQLALRLLVTAGSRLLELGEMRGVLGDFDPGALVYPWKHPDAEVDRLAEDAFRLVSEEQEKGRTREEIFGGLWRRAYGSEPPVSGRAHIQVPYLDEPWYCCAEPAPSRGAVV
ncbi:MAG TPA: CUAEP/CCAEP-tail radical SAM protein [Bryobacteraceae bacterium]|nr:CUAEP/CCAEP-tail radical SAM protein [Bryobacteraceae bacterium]